MRVRMLTNITGTRNEAPWPPAGGIIELPDHEAADLIHAGYAEEVTDATPDEPPPATTGPGTAAVDASGDPTGESGQAEEAGPVQGADAVKPPARRRTRKPAAG